MKNDRIHVINRFKWFLYELKLKIFGREKKSKSAKPLNKKAGQRMFLFFFMLLPVLQFLIFYVGVNINSFRLAFLSFDGDKFVFSNFDNFKNVIRAIFVTGELSLPIKNSAIQFLAGLLIGMPLQVMVAYVVFKKVPLGGFYKVMLFMPNIISSLVFVICVRLLVQKGLPIMFNDPYLNLLSDLNSSSFYTVLVFGLWMNFAAGLIIYLSAMSGISKDILEYGELENMSSLKELWYIIIPSIFPTIVTYVVVTIAGFFMNYGHFYSFFGGEGRGEKPFDTLGYYFFVKVVGDNASLSDYPFAAAGGVLFTLVVAPITLFVKRMLEKYGPSEE